MIDRQRIAAVVLAGGQGRRMGGVEKGLVEIAGKSMLEWTLDALRPQVGEVIVNANGSVQAYERFGARVVPDKLEGFQGPLAGLHAAFSAVERDYLLCVPCDAPRLPPDLAQRLGEAIEREEADDQAGHVLAGGRFDAFQARRRVDLHHQRAVVGAQQVDAGDVQAHDLGRAHRGGALFGRDLDQAGRSAAVEVGAELAGLWLVHRHGHLDVGEASVIAAASSRHRDEAFKACRHLVEEMKHRAPIWKKEHYVDGDSEWVQGHALCGHG